MRWTQSEIDLLIDLYPNNTTKTVSIILKRSKESVRIKASKLKLNKSKEHRSLVHQNTHRDLSNESLKLHKMQK